LDDRSSLEKRSKISVAIFRRRNPNDIDVQLRPIAATASRVAHHLIVTSRWSPLGRRLPRRFAKRQATNGGSQPNLGARRR
jgi:hypothetical protein